MKRSTKLLGAMAGLALVMSFGVQKAQAGDLLYPYIVNTATEESVLTMITPVGRNTATNVHIQYWTKAPTAASDAACQASSVFVQTSDNDMMTWGVGDTFGPLGPLLNDPQDGGVGGGVGPGGVNMGFSNQIGYAILAGNTIATGAQVDLNKAGSGAAAGYTLHIDFGNGNVTSNHAINITTNQAGTLFDQALTMAITPTGNDAIIETAAAGAALAVAGVPVDMFPPASTSGLVTSFNVTPLSDAMFTTPGLATVQLDGSAAAAIQAIVYDRDEAAFDSTVPVDVQCVANLTLADLMPAIVGRAGFKDSGGWAYFNVTNATGVAGGNAAGYAAIVYKVESDTAQTVKTMTEVSIQ